MEVRMSITFVVHVPEGSQMLPGRAGTSVGAMVELPDGRQVGAFPCIAAWAAADRIDDGDCEPDVAFMDCDVERLLGVPGAILEGECDWVTVVDPVVAQASIDRVSEIGQEVMEIKRLEWEREGVVLENLTIEGVVLEPTMSASDWEAIRASRGGLRL